MCGEAEAEGLGVGSNRMYECTFRCMKCKNAARWSLKFLLRPPLKICNVM